MSCPLPVHECNLHRSAKNCAISYEDLINIFHNLTYLICISISFIQDLVLAELLTTQKDWIVKYHEHDSLLENRPDEHLSEEEREKAWEEYEREKQGLYTNAYTYPQQQQHHGGQMMMMQQQPNRPQMYVTSVNSGGGGQAPPPPFVFSRATGGYVSKCL